MAKFDNFSDMERALLSRALNTELNTIAKLIKDHPDTNANFKNQYMIVYNMWDSVYPHGDDPFTRFTWEQDLAMRFPV